MVSKRSNARRRTSVRAPATRQNAPTAIDRLLRRLAARRAPMPAQVEVELATLVDAAPDGDDWLHEIKFDGYRMLCRIRTSKSGAASVQFISRNGNDWSPKFPQLIDSARRLPVETAIVDGEVVMLEPDGSTSFQLLQNAFRDGRSEGCAYFAFDLLYLNGHDLRSLPIEDRKQLLQAIIPAANTGAFRFSEHIVGNGPKFFAEAGRRRLEGIICKRRGRPYLAGRGSDWLKVKTSLRQEFVIGGFTKPAGSRSNFGALLLGYYNPQRQLVYAGRVGTGFDVRTLAALHPQLVRLARRTSPFVNPPPATGTTWTSPRLVAQVEFSNWTNEGLLRHPRFLGLRVDKSAAQVTNELPAKLPAARGRRKPSTRRVGQRT